MRVLTPLFAAALYCGSLIALLTMTAASPAAEGQTTIRLGPTTVVAVESTTLIVRAADQTFVEKEIS